MTTLSRERIVEAATALAESSGIEGLTMRELATGLGVGTMSIYHHLPDKLALHQAIADHLWSQLRIPDPDSPWDERLRELTVQLWQVARRHPALIPLLLTRRFTGPEGLPAVESMLAAARDAGFDAAGSVHCFRVLAGFAVGLAQAEGARARAGREHAPTPPRAGGEPSGPFPHLHAALSSGALDRPDEELSFGLDAILTGFRAALSPGRVARR